MLKSKTATAGFLLLLVFLLQGCGRKGPLFIQQAPATPVPVKAATEVNAQPEQTKPAQNPTIQNPSESKIQP